MQKLTFNASEYIKTTEITIKTRIINSEGTRGAQSRRGRGTESHPRNEEPRRAREHGAGEVDFAKTLKHLCFEFNPTD